MGYCPSRLTSTYPSISISTQKADSGQLYLKLIVLSKELALINPLDLCSLALSYKEEAHIKNISAAEIGADFKSKMQPPANDKSPSICFSLAIPARCLYVSVLIRMVASGLRRRKLL